MKHNSTKLSSNWEDTILSPKPKPYTCILYEIFFQELAKDFLFK